MAQTYRLTTSRKLVNWIMTTLLRLGIPIPTTYLLTVRGRRSRKLYSTPISLVERGDQRWLVAPYGAVNWVRNARAAGQVTLTRRGRSEIVKIAELGPEESAPILKEYVQRNPITRPYFDATPDSPPEAFASEASRHPAFRIVGPA